MLLEFTLLICLISAVVGFFLGKKRRKLLLLVALIPFVFVTILSIHDLYFADMSKGGGPPMTPILFFTLAIPLAFFYVIFFYVGFKNAKKKSKNDMG